MLYISYKLFWRGEIMENNITFKDLVKKVQQQEDTVVQLVKIVAATNHRISELQLKQERLEKKAIYH